MSFVLKRTLAVAVLLALACLAVGWGTRAVTMREVRDQLTGEATLLAEHAARSLDGIDLTLGALAQKIESRWRDGMPPSAGYHQVFARRVKDLPQVTGIVLLDRDGNLLADQVTARPRPFNLSERGYFRAHAEGELDEGRFLGDPVRGGVTGKAFFSASYAIQDPRGDFGGVLAATFDPFYYQRHQEHGQLAGGRRDVALVDEDGMILASSSDFAAAIELSKEGGRPIGQDPAGRNGTVRPALTADGVIRFTLLSSGQTHLAALAEVPLYPFYAYVGLVEDEAFRSWTYLAYGLGGAWATVTLASAAAFAGMWRRETERREAFAALKKVSYEARDALERAEAASAAKSRFLAHMSHELRTPLNAILGFSEIIRDGVFGDNPARDREYADLIHSSGRHLLQIINDILDLSRIEAGKLKVQPRLVALSPLCEDAVLLTSQDFEDHGVGVSTRLAPGCPPLFADEKAAKQMLVNLLSNAAKFSPPGSLVELAAEPSADGGLVMLITDQGPGIARDRLATVFEPFAQASAGVSVKGQGTGLGLPLVKSLIELHGGRIEIESELDRGTRVSLFFPPPPPEAATAGTT